MFIYSLHSPPFAALRNVLTVVVETRCFKIDKESRMNTYVIYLFQFKKIIIERKIQKTCLLDFFEDFSLEPDLQRQSGFLLQS